MKLLTKITSVILLGIIVLLVIDGFITVRREVTLFDNDMARDGILLGRAMKELIVTKWKNEGMGAAMELIREANKEEQQIGMRWVWLDAPPGDPFSPRLPQDDLRRLTEEHEYSYKLAVPGKPGYRLTYVVVPFGGERTGAMELSEPLTSLKHYARHTIVRTSVLTAGMVVLSSILIWLMGVRFIARPLEILVEKTRRVGAGDFGGDVELPGKEELSSLAAALNEMCRQLETARDTLRRETEARIDTLEQLRHAERLATVGRLASGVAHELGTPLNVVSGRAKIIATEKLDREEVVSFARTIAAQADRMTEIIRQLLDFARRRSSQRAPVDVAQLTGQVIDLLSVTARKSNVTLGLEKTVGAPHVEVDRSQIQQVLMNLVMNGIQAMPGGGRLLITLGVANVRHPGVPGGEERKYLRVAVSDEGEGIPREHIELVFDPFFTTKGVGKGTGLGLSISYGIVQEHGGWIDVQSELGKGSCFSIYLPLEENG